MLLSEMLGVEMDTDFGVEGYYGKFRVRVNTGYEFLVVSDGKGAYDPVVNGATVYGIIDAAPAGIICLPPLLTDEQREQLMALYRLGYRYITRTISLTIEAHVGKPRQVMNEWTQGGLHAYVPYVNGGLYGLPVKNETEPYDIAKALGVEG